MTWTERDGDNLDRLCIAAEKIAEKGSQEELQYEILDLRNTESHFKNFVLQVYRLAKSFERMLNDENLNPMERAKAIRDMQANFEMIAGRQMEILGIPEPKDD